MKDTKDKRRTIKGMGKEKEEEEEEEVGCEEENTDGMEKAGIHGHHFFQRDPSP